MNKPVIGITVDIEEGSAPGRQVLKLNENYAQAVSSCGGVPILISPETDASAVIEMVDGILIPGGPDIDAKHWGEANHEKAVLQVEERYEAETALLRAVPEAMPVLGICYGCQLMNVSRGGTLRQHLPDEVGHAGHEGGTLQEYELEAGSRLAEAMDGTKAEGKSYHHQAVGRLGTGLRATARHGADGVIEAIEASDLPFFVGVQWHPERMLEDAGTRRLFESFIAAAQEYRQAKCGQR